MTVTCCRTCQQPLPADDVIPFRRPWMPRPYEVFMVLGMTGSGKSYLFKRWLSLLMQAERACFVVDVSDEYSRGGNSRGNKLELGPLTTRLTVPEFLAAHRRSSAFIRNPRAAVAIVPTVTDAGAALADHLRPVLRILYGRGNCIIGFDETQKYGAELAPELYRAAGELGKDGVTPFFLSQHPGGVPERVRKQVSTCISAEMGKGSDRQMLAADFDKAFAAALRRVLPRTFFCGFSRSQFAAGIPKR